MPKWHFGKSKQLLFLVTKLWMNLSYSNKFHFSENFGILIIFFWITNQKLENLQFLNIFRNYVNSCQRGPTCQIFNIFEKDFKLADVTWRQHGEQQGNRPTFGRFRQLRRAWLRALDARDRGGPTGGSAARFWSPEQRWKRRTATATDGRWWNRG